MLISVSPFDDCSVVGGSSNAAMLYACLRVEDDPDPLIDRRSGKPRDRFTWHSAKFDRPAGRGIVQHRVGSRRPSERTSAHRPLSARSSNLPRRAGPPIRHVWEVADQSRIIKPLLVFGWLSRRATTIRLQILEIRANRDLIGAVRSHDNIRDRFPCPIWTRARQPRRVDGTVSAWSLTDRLDRASHIRARVCFSRYSDCGFVRRIAPSLAC
jgi:hypothetical protein